VRLLTDAVQNGTKDNFEKAISKKNLSPDDVEAGREYIEAYVLLSIMRKGYMRPLSSL